MLGVATAVRIDPGYLVGYSEMVVILTGGNGTRHVMVIIGAGKGLDLEDLAVGESPRMRQRTEHSNQLARRECDKDGNFMKDLEGKDKKKILMLCGVLVSFWITQVSCLILAFLWIVFLITVAGLKQNTWYLLAIWRTWYDPECSGCKGESETKHNGLSLD
jgi:hypothetical protein